MATYVALVIPESWFLARFGLRPTLIVGAILNSIGAIIKLASAHPELFWVTMLGQVICALGKVSFFLLRFLAPHAVYFGHNFF